MNSNMNSLEVLILRILYTSLHIQSQERGQCKICLLNETTRNRILHYQKMCQLNMLSQPVFLIIEE